MKDKFNWSDLHSWAKYKCMKPLSPAFYVKPEGLYSNADIPSLKITQKVDRKFKTILVKLQ